MRYDRIKFCGFEPYVTEVELDLRPLPFVVAVAGKNGHGKTTLLEMMPATLWRRTRSGLLAERATSIDSWTQLEFTNERGSYTIRQTVNCDTGGGESLVYRTAEPMLPLVGSAKVSHVDKWVTENVIAPSIYYASAFCAQPVKGPTGFLGLDASEAKDVILRARSLDHLERMAKDARARHDQCAECLAMLTVKIDSLTLGGDVAEAEGKEEVLLALVSDQRAAIARLQTCAQERTSALAAFETRRQWSERRAELTGVVESATAELADIEVRKGNGAKVVAMRERIEAAVATSERCAKTITDQQLEIDRAIEARSAADVFARNLGSKLSELVKDTRVAVDRRAAIEASRANSEQLAIGYENHASQAAELARRLTDAEEALARELQALDGTIERRHENAVEFIEAVATRVVADPIDQQARAVLVADRKAALTYAEAVARGAGADARRTIDTIKREISVCTVSEERAKTHRKDAADHVVMLADLDTAIVGLTKDRAAAADAHKIASDAAEAARLLEMRAREEIAKTKTEREAAEKMAQYATVLAGHSARVIELDERAIGATKRQEEARDALARLLQSEPPEVTVPRDTTSELRAAEKQLEDAVSRVGAAKAGVQYARERTAERAPLEAQRAALVAEVEDWALLGSDLGRDGLQALEVDALGPQLGEIASELLSEVWSGRFGAAVSTTRMSSDNKREVEQFKIQVHDCQTGRVRDAMRFSGGERAIIGEALNLSLATIACQGAGLFEPTLIRDETGAPLDPEHAAEYVAMLRRAGGLIRASRVLFVSHTQEARDCADGRITVGNGRIVVS